MKQTSRENIIREAQKIFAQKGFKGTSVREISAKAKVNLSAISYHFSGKKGLYKACFEEFGQETISFGQMILSKPRNKEDFSQKLQSFSSHMLEMYAERPDLVKLAIKEVENGELFTSEGPEGTSEGPEGVFTKFFLGLVQFFEDANEAAMVNPSFKSETVASVFMGTFLQAICFDSQRASLFQRSLMSDKYYRQEYSEHITKIFINGLSAL